MIYTVTFNPAIDYVLHLTAPLAVGEINRTSDEACQFGGKGINVSGVLRELGCESIALASLAARASMFPAFCGSLGAKASPLALQLAKLVPGWSAACSFPA